MNVIGFDDGPFAREHRGDVLLVGVVASGTRVDGIVSGKIRRDGANSTATIAELVRRSGSGAQAVLLHGIAVGGFNVVDIHALAIDLGVPVLVTLRRPPDLAAVKRALARVPGAARKWRLIEAAGAIEELLPSRRASQAGKDAGPRVFVQRAGMSLEEARNVVRATTLHGNIPEALRVAHLVAGGVVTGKSRGRA